MESLKSSFTAQQAQSLTDAIQEVINNAMMSARTMLPCEIAEEGKDKGGIYWYKVQPLLNRQTTSGKWEKASTMLDVVATNIRCGNTGLLLKYKKGDKVIVGVSDRDWNLIKQSWEIGNTQGNVFHELSSAFIFGYLEKTPPLNYIDFTDDKNMAIHNPEKLIIENKETDIKTQQFKVSGLSTSLDTTAVSLGSNAVNGVLISNTVLTLLNANVTFNGVTGAMSGTMTFANGSLSVKASI